MTMEIQFFLSRVFFRSSAAANMRKHASWWMEMQLLVGAIPKGGTAGQAHVQHYWCEPPAVLSRGAVRTAPYPLGNNA